jgi:hypothetical protein
MKILAFILFLFVVQSCEKNDTGITVEEYEKFNQRISGALYIPEEYENNVDIFNNVQNTIKYIDWNDKGECAIIYDGIDWNDNYYIYIKIQKNQNVGYEFKDLKIYNSIDEFNSKLVYINEELKKEGFLKEMSMWNYVEEINLLQFPMTYENHSYNAEFEATVTYDKKKYYYQATYKVFLIKDQSEKMAIYDNMKYESSISTFERDDFYNFGKKLFRRIQHIIGYSKNPYSDSIVIIIREFICDENLQPRSFLYYYIADLNL